jgi:predicted nucleic acid-binding protein
MQPLVLDASVLIKWVVPPANEMHIEQAYALQREITWRNRDVVLPALWYFEVGNTLGRRFPDHATTQLERLLAMGFRQADLKRILEPAMELVRRYGVTFYDATYHATALAYGGVLVTGDQRYLDVAAPAGNILALAEWPLGNAVSEKSI